MSIDDGQRNTRFGSLSISFSNGSREIGEARAGTRGGPLSLRLAPELHMAAAGPAPSSCPRRRTSRAWRFSRRCEPTASSSAATSGRLATPIDAPWRSPAVQPRRAPGTCLCAAARPRAWMLSAGGSPSAPMDNPLQKARCRLPEARHPATAGAHLPWLRQFEGAASRLGPSSVAPSSRMSCSRVRRTCESTECFKFEGGICRLGPHGALAMALPTVLSSWRGFAGALIVSWSPSGVMPSRAMTPDRRHSQRPPCAAMYNCELRRRLPTTTTSPWARSPAARCYGGWA